jgi:hypothetical protein
MAVCDIQMKNKDKTLSLKIPVNQISGTGYLSKFQALNILAKIA